MALEPRLFTLDLNTVEHKLFYTELQSLCDADDPRLMRLPCYKNLTNLVPLRRSAISQWPYPSHNPNTHQPSASAPQRNQSVALP